MAEQPYAAVLTHVPSTGETFYTPFGGDTAAADAQAFYRSESGLGDFPGSLWTIVYNDAADRQRVRNNIVALVGEGPMVDEILATTETPESDSGGRQP